jgi:DNA polymerase-3 subunit alpha
VDKIVIVRGRVDHKEEGEIKLVAQEVEAFEPSAEEVLAAAESAPAEPIVRRLTIQVAPGVPESFLEDLREVVSHTRATTSCSSAWADRQLLLGPDWQVSAGRCLPRRTGALTGTARLVA